MNWTEQDLANHNERWKKWNAAPSLPVKMAPEFKQAVETAKVIAKGRQHTPGIMNKTEACYAAYLEQLKKAGDVAWYAFEGVRLRLAKQTTYTPDFIVMNADGTIECHEVKGAKAIFWDDAKVKVKVAAEMFPFNFKVVYPSKTDGWVWETY